MSKPLFVISCPADTYSGYGARSRDLVKAIIATDRYDVKILSQRWGNCRFGYLADHGETDMISRIIPNVDPNKQPDYWMQITVPNEFQRVGKFNIHATQESLPPSAQASQIKTESLMTGCAWPILQVPTAE